MQARVALFVCAGLMAGLAPARAVRADAATEEARQHYLKGNQFFDVGRWDDAAGEYEKAYAIRNDPSLLYNMAQAYRRKGDAKRAVDLYKNYLMRAPKSPLRDEVEERIRVLQQQIDDADAKAASVTPSPAPEPASAAPVAPAAPTAPAPEPAYPSYPAAAGTPSSPNASPTGTSASPGYPGPVGYAAASQPPYVQAPSEPAAPTKPGRGLRIAGVICGVTGATAVGAGIAFGALAKSYSDSVQAGEVFNPNFDRRGKLYETLQWVGYGAGAGLIAAGAIFYGIGATTGAKTSVAPVALPGGAGLSAGGTF
jgi:tetratricopeptide (TPR) repeat protein